MAKVRLGMMLEWTWGTALDVEELRKHSKGRGYPIEGSKNIADDWCLKMLHVVEQNDSVRYLRASNSIFFSGLVIKKLLQHSTIQYLQYFFFPLCERHVKQDISWADPSPNYCPGNTQVLHILL